MSTKSHTSKSHSYPLWTVRWTPEERATIAALRANLRHDHGALTIAGTIRVALAQLATFRGIELNKS